MAKNPDLDTFEICRLFTRVQGISYVPKILSVHIFIEKMLVIRWDYIFVISVYYLLSIFDIIYPLYIYIYISNIIKGKFKRCTSWDVNKLCSLRFFCATNNNNNMVTKCSLRGTENHQQKEPLNITNTHTHTYIIYEYKL